MRWRSSSRCDRCRRGERGLGGRGVSRSTITRRLKRSAKPAARPSRFCTVRRRGPAGAESPSADPGVRHAAHAHAHAPSGVDVDQSVRRSARRARRPRLNRSPRPPTPDAPAPVRPDIAVLHRTVQRRGDRACTCAIRASAGAQRTRSSLVPAGTPRPGTAILAEVDDTGRMVTVEQYLITFGSKTYGV